MAPFFKGIDVFLLCSRNEGMANVLNEAMSHGKPVVSTRVPGSEELLAHGKHGVLTDIDDTPALSRALLSIIKGEQLFSAAEQTRWIGSEFSMERMISETELLFFGSRNIE
jgi:glycosyltransferase involved in cell wall biosynthesis